MAILDLQKMQGAPSDSTRAGRSGASKNCGNVSNISLLLC